MSRTEHNAGHRCDEDLRSSSWSSRHRRGASPLRKVFRREGATCPRCPRALVRRRRCPRPRGTCCWTQCLVGRLLSFPLGEDEAAVPPLGALARTCAEGRRPYEIHSWCRAPTARRARLRPGRGGGEGAGRSSRRRSRAPHRARGRAMPRVAAASRTPARESSTNPRPSAAASDRAKAVLPTPDEPRQARQRIGCRRARFASPAARWSSSRCFAARTRRAPGRARA